MKLNEYLKSNLLIPDGPMGTYYSGLINQPGAIPEYANLSSPEIIESIHKEYLAAGARILRTNTFAANQEVLEIDSEEQRKLIEAACHIAKKARQAYEQKNDKEKIWVFGNMGPIPEDGDRDEEDIFDEYKNICDIFIKEGLDGIHFETFSNTSYIEKLVPYIKEKKEDMFLLATFSVNKNGYTAAGISASRIFDKVAQIEEIDGCGFNCGIGSGHMYQILKKINFPENKFIYAAPNAGYPEQMQNRMVFINNTEYFTDNMKLIAELGVNMVGGCCGITPDYIKALVEHIGYRKKELHPQNKVNLRTDNISPVKTNEFFEKLQSGKKVIAVELDPPFDANIDQVMECAHKLKYGGADIITFADSPMGRSRVDSILMSIKIAEETGLSVMPHICCRDRNMISMRSVLLGAYIHGIRNLLIVTGDPVPGENRTKATGVFDYNSLKLMDYVKEMNVEHFANEPYYYGGALNHSRGSVDKVVARMKRKMEAGATYFLTQPIYTDEDINRIKEIKERVDAKLLCGIMPLVSYRNACFIKNEITGINVPEEVVSRYHPDMSREEAEQVGASIALEVMERLAPFADGYYFMLPFNRVSLMEKIFKK